MNTTETTRMKFPKDFPAGTRVTVCRPYTGSGTFGIDGFEGTWFVCEPIGDADMKLARTYEDAMAGDYDVMIHMCRILEANWHADNATRGVL